MEISPRLFSAILGNFVLSLYIFYLYLFVLYVYTVNVFTAINSINQSMRTMSMLIVISPMLQVLEQGT